MTKPAQVVEADIAAHDERIKEMNEQADSLVKSKNFKENGIDGKRELINQRYKKVRALADHWQTTLNDTYTLHQFFREAIQHRNRHDLKFCFCCIIKNS